MTDINFTVLVSRVTLSDGSHVYNVVLGAPLLPAVTELDAIDMAEKIRDAAAEHSLAFAPRVAFDY